ncbi:very short patch repair endonuclease [Actinoplanes sp. NPDC000266]
MADEARSRAWETYRHPQPLNEGRSRNMQAIRRSDTKPEIRLRALLHSHGLRFRKDLRLDLDGVRVRPDIVFTRKRVAIFVDGCFWHLCPEHGRKPKVNDWYWGPKLARTVQRDQEATSALTAAGWEVIRVWEHEPPEDAAARIKQVISPPPAAG